MLRKLLRAISPQAGNAKRNRIAPRALTLEQLEDRRLLTAAPTVATLATSAGPDLTSYSGPPSSAFTPQQIRAAYGINSIALGSLVGNGAGQTIAIVDAYDDPDIQNDLHQFDLAFGLPDPPSFIKYNGNGATTNYPPTDPNGPGYSQSWELEEAMDVEWAHAVAPQANIDLVEANSPGLYDYFSTAVKTATQLPGVSVVSMSFSLTEAYMASENGELNYDQFFTTPVGHTGITFLASSGDSGSPGGYPAFSPNVIAVGGTSLTLSGGSYGSETAWSGSGGGQSVYEAEPSYQTGVQQSGQRQTPDVAFDANPNTGVAIYDSYDFGSSYPWVQDGGTSLGAPCWAGLIAIADQLRVAQGYGTLDGPSQTLPDLYALPASDFHDITSGSNGGFSAGPGYDEVTGLGTPIANKLVLGLVPQETHTTTVLGLSAAATGYGQPLILTATVTAAQFNNTALSGTVTFLDGANVLGSATLNSGQASLQVSTLAVGLHGLTATYSGDGVNYAGSTTAIGSYSIITPVAGNGTSGESGDGGLATAAELLGGQAVAVDTAGDIFIGDGSVSFLGDSYSYRVREVNHANGLITTLAGNGTAGYSGDGGPATAAELGGPVGLAVDAAGDLFIGDAANNRVREVNYSTGVITTVAGDGTAGYSGDGGLAIAAELGRASGSSGYYLAVDNQGNLFISDAGNLRIREVNLSTGVITTCVSESYTPGAIAVDTSGHLFVAVDYEIQKVTVATGATTIVAGNGKPGSNGDHGQATAAEITPGAIAIDSAGDVFLTDDSDSLPQIREVNVSTGLITTVVGDGVVGRGGDNGPATAAQMYSPDGIALDGAGDLFIADGAIAEIREVPSGGTGVTVLPVVTGVSPPGAPLAGASVTILGAGFSGATAVYFGTVVASSFSVNSAGTQITVTCPAESAATVDVTVVTPGGTSAVKRPADQFTYSAAALWTLIGTGDINGDGTPDMIWQDQTTGAVGAWLMNNGVNTAWAALGSADPTVWTLAGTGYFTGSKTADLLWVNKSTGEVGLWLMSNATVTGWATLGSAPPSVWSVVGIGDFNPSNGTSDILWENTSGEVGAWMIQNATISAWSTFAYVDPTQWKVAGVGDFNGDGTADVLWQNTNTGVVGAWLVSNGSVSSWMNLGTADPTVWKVAGVGYFNGSSTSDVLWQNQSTGAYGEWLVQGGSVTWASLPYVDPTQWQLIAVANVSGGASPDMVWEDLSTGTVGAWIIQNAVVSGWTSLGSA